MTTKSLMIVLTLVAACGCQSQTPVKEAFFAPDDQPRLTTSVIETQAARGARADATLYAAHFDGEALNSLGRAKLSLMVRDNDSALPVVVYVSDRGEGVDVGARQEAVRTYLLDAGLTPVQFRTVIGANPATSHPVAGDIARMSKTESGEGKAAGEVATEPAANLGDLSQGLGLTKK